MFMRGVLLLGVIAVIALVLLFVHHAAAFSSSIELNGKLFGADGKQLYPTQGNNYWLGSDGKKFDIDQNNDNHLVVMGNGRVVGTGTINSLQYELRLYNEWQQEPRLAVYAGFYDAVRPDRTQLLYCTSFEPSKIPLVRKVLVDFTCEHITLVEGSTGAYR